MNKLRSILLVAIASGGAFADPVAKAPTLQKVATFKHQVTGVTVSEDGRVFVNFPRWTEDSAVSVAEVTKAGQVVPYPNADWNAWRNASKDTQTANDHFVCVQSVVADGHGHLWVLDPASPAMDKVVPNGPKLVEITLATNKVERTIAFPEAIAPQGSYLNDIRFSPDQKTAYITDSGARGAIVVLDLGTGKARRVLDGDPSTQPDKSVTVTADGKPLRRPDGRGVDFAADGIALSPDGKTLYWQAIRGKTLYSIATDALAGANPTTAVKTVGENGPADGLWISKTNRMYVSSPEDNAIKVRDLNQPASQVTRLLTDARLRWPDTFSEGPDGAIYITSSHIQDSATYKPGAPGALTTELWRFTP
ncbi:MAG TPA: L-dopachrome tautomerase-related protein [Kofleriaceae bacterium]